MNESLAYRCPHCKSPRNDEKLEINQQSGERFLHISYKEGCTLKLEADKKGNWTIVHQFCAKYPKTT